MGFIADYFAKATSLFLPHRCVVCERPVNSGYLCSCCAPSVETLATSSRCLHCYSDTVFEHTQGICEYCLAHQTPLNRQRYLCEYEGKARQLVLAMKYNPSIKLADWAGELLAENLDSLFRSKQSWDMVVPIPSSPVNYRKRLFSPSRVLAQRVADSISLPCRTDILMHTVTSQPQATINKRLRVKSAQKSLKHTKKSLSGCAILLIDDVVTSGATAYVAAMLLRESGAVSVDLLSLARAPAWSRERCLLHTHSSILAPQRESFSLNRNYE